MFWECMPDDSTKGKSSPEDNVLHPIVDSKP